MVFLSRQPNKVFSTEKLRPPNPYCVVSGVSRTILSVNPTQFTLGNLVEDVIKNNEYLNYESDVTIISSTLLYDSDFDDNMTKSLGELGVRNGSFLTVIDDEDDGRVNLEIYIEENLETEKFELSHVPAMPQKLAPRSTSDGEEDNKELSIEQNKEEEEEEEAGQKRKLEDGEINTPSKRQKVNESDEMEDDVVIIDDDDDIIELD
jgi:ubiquitin-like 1-activating enzyme E1 B